ncbi:MAG: proton-translocating transhydrogenase family protein, partial [Pseudomonadota bacterium]
MKAYAQEAPTAADTAVAVADASAEAVAVASGGAIDPTIYRVAIFVLAIFVGYYVVWSVTPALHTPLMSVTTITEEMALVT